eukprot:142116-Pyramimonas_sp.AAC.1
MDLSRGNRLRPPLHLLLWPGAKSAPRDTTAFDATDGHATRSLLESLVASLCEDAKVTALSSARWTFSRSEKNSFQVVASLG